MELGLFLHFSEIFLKSDGSPLEAGDIMRRSKLADTLEMIANEGSKAFYNGTLTDVIAEEIQSCGMAFNYICYFLYTSQWHL